MTNSGLLTSSFKPPEPSSQIHQNRQSGVVITDLDDHLAQDNSSHNADILNEINHGKLIFHLKLFKCSY